MVGATGPRRMRAATSRSYARHRSSDRPVRNGTPCTCDPGPRHVPERAAAGWPRADEDPAGRPARPRRDRRVRHRAGRRHRDRRLRPLAGTDATRPDRACLDRRRGAIDLDHTGHADPCPDVPPGWLPDGPGADRRRHPPPPAAAAAATARQHRARRRHAVPGRRLGRRVLDEQSGPADEVGPHGCHHRGMGLPRRSRVRVVHDQSGAGRRRLAIGPRRDPVVRWGSVRRCHPVADPLRGPDRHHRIAGRVRLGDLVPVRPTALGRGLVERVVRRPRLDRRRLVQARRVARSDHLVHERRGSRPRRLDRLDAWVCGAPRLRPRRPRRR